MSDKTIADLLQDQFKCDKCGLCCSVGGQIYIDPYEAQAIADYLCIDPKDESLFPFHQSIEDPSLLFLEVTYPCFFLDKVERTCMIYEVRPKMCRTYPFRILVDGDCGFVDSAVCPKFRSELTALLKSPAEV